MSVDISESNGKNGDPISHNLSLEYRNVVRPNYIGMKAVLHRCHPSGEAVLKPLVGELWVFNNFKYIPALSSSRGLMEELACGEILLASEDIQGSEQVGLVSLRISEDAAQTEVI